MKYSYYFNEQVLSLGYRIHNLECKFYVCYTCGLERCFVGRVSSISALARALRARLGRDGSIFDVSVYLPGGVLLCECGRF